MCGIAAVLYKTLDDTQRQPVGLQLREMLHSMRHRGADSTGVTISGQRFNSDYVLNAFLPDASTHGDAALRAVSRSIVQSGATVESSSRRDRFLRFGVNFKGNPKVLADSVLAVKGVEIHNLGRCSEIIKDVGDAYDLDKKHGIGAMKGTHGLGHVRLATESEVDISHSHPFWAYPFPDISVVHNGQLTNYHEMKRKFQQRGFTFQTHNDSEVISVYIAEKLSRGVKLNDALHESLEDLDGTFTYVVCTSTGIGMAKDRWSAKPFVIYETGKIAAVASEEVALRRAFPDRFERFEPQENQVMTWEASVAPMIRSR
jgi:methylamine---glutamate N-methyltransferase subunit A